MQNHWSSRVDTNKVIKIRSLTPLIARESERGPALQQQELEQPEGSIQPKKSSITSVAYFRDPLVKAWVLKNAQGACEACSSPAPFNKSDGSPYLEVHHLRPLSEGGSDIVENCIAICPNCHRRLHFGSDKNSLVEAIRSSVGRLDKNDDR